MIRDMVREFTKKEVEPRDKWMDENGFDYELHKKLTQAGLMGIHLDEKYGGGGGDAVTSIIVIHEIAKGSASEASMPTLNSQSMMPFTWPTPSIVWFTTPESGIFTRMAPKPMGTSRAGSMFFLMPR